MQINPKSEILLIAYAIDTEGFLSIVDLVETWRANAPFFARSFYRNPDITHMAALKPCDDLRCADPRRINR